MNTPAQQPAPAPASPTGAGGAMLASLLATIARDAGAALPLAVDLLAYESADREAVFAPELLALVRNIQNDVAEARDTLARATPPKRRPYARTRKAVAAEVREITGDLRATLGRALGTISSETFDASDVAMVLAKAFDQLVGLEAVADTLTERTPAEARP